MPSNRTAFAGRASLLGVPGGLVLGLLVATLVVPPIATSNDTLTATRSCGASDSNVPSEVVELRSAKDVWLEFPAMRRAPLLESDDSPATLVVFPAGFDSTQGTSGNPLAGTPSADVGTVICVRQASGYVSVFTNVPTQGSRLSP
jgi:hypothetical protein